jgi:hypothetical protein
MDARYKKNETCADVNYHVSQQMTNVRKQFIEELKVEQTKMMAIRVEKQKNRDAIIARLREEKEKRRA